MASPHAAGVAALIVSQFGTLGSDGDVEDVAEQGRGDTCEALGGRHRALGLRQCFGHGRIDALRAVEHDTSARVRRVGAVTAPSTRSREGGG